MQLRDGKAIVLLRFHEYGKRIEQQIELLSLFNPDLELHGLFGGPIETVPPIGLTSCWTFPGETSKWKWQNSDLMVRRWFKSFGHELDFDFVFSYEYDLFTVAPLLALYPNIDDKSLALAAVTAVEDLPHGSWTWIHEEPWKRDFESFIEYMHKKYGASSQKRVCLGPGMLLSRQFLVDWLELPEVEIVHDELRVPAFAELLGYDLVDHLLHPGFNQPERGLLFNCWPKEVEQESIKKELRKPDGRRAFHPVKQAISPSLMKAALNLDRN